MQSHTQGEWQPTRSGDKSNGGVEIIGAKFPSVREGSLESCSTCSAVSPGKVLPEIFIKDPVTKNKSVHSIDELKSFLLY